MSNFFHLSGPTRGRSLSVKSTHLGFKKGTLKLGLGVFFAVILVAYVVQVNAIATKGYYIKELQGTIDDLRRQRETLRAEATQLQSMATVKNRVGNLEMVTANDADFIVPTPVAVAR